MTARASSNSRPIVGSSIAGRSRTSKRALRPAAEFALWQKRDPVELYRAALVGDGTLSKTGFEAMVAAARAEIDDAVAFAQASPFPERHELSLHVFPERRP